ncbi:hypothetical protein AB8Z38_11570 [Bradyrhizobium sp. LLZ17]|uniref:Phage major capsid protein n=1 Tax=Bradyrhizobium sp. LLZ17 TaxID=3239388 RepID=A0AB39XR34_9BRAD
MNAPARQGIPLRPDPGALLSSQRRSFIRAATAVALASRDRQRPDAILAKAWPDDATAPRMLKGATSPTTSGGGYPQVQTIAVLPMLAPSSASARLLELASSVDLAGVSSVAVPYIGASGRPVVPFVEEGKPMPVVDMTISGIRVGPVKKLLIGSALTNELQNASNDTASTIIGGALATSAEQSMDALLLSAAAATAAAPAGILEGVAAIPSAGTSGAEGIANDLALLAESIASNGIGADEMIVITTPALATKLRCLVSLKFSNEVLSSSSIPAGEVIAVAAGGLVTGYDGGVTIEVSEEPTLHFEDAAPTDISIPGAPAAVAAPTISIWQTDSLAVKVRGWCAWAVHPGAVAYVTGAAW